MLGLEVVRGVRLHANAVLATAMSAIKWYKNTKAKQYSTSVSKTSTPCPTRLVRLPQDSELVEIIVSYLFYDTPALLPCSTPRDQREALPRRETRSLKHSRERTSSVCFKFLSLASDSASVTTISMDISLLRIWVDSPWVIFPRP